MAFYSCYILDMWGENCEKDTPLDDETYGAILVTLSHFFIDELMAVNEKQALTIAEKLVNGGYEMRWACSNEDMQKLAKQFPHVKFELEEQSSNLFWCVCQYWGNRWDVAVAQRPVAPLFK